MADENKTQGIIDRVREVRDWAAWVRWGLSMAAWAALLLAYITGKSPTPPPAPPPLPAQVMPQAQPLILVVTTGGAVPQVVPAATSK